MCAIISGAMDVVELEKETSSTEALTVYKQLNRAKAGDILGEMGLLRNMPRSATVIATEPSEYLEINLKMIKRLQWLYPPTANRFFMNLMTILCNRIERVTQNFAAVSTTDDLTGWYNRKGFAGVLETEMNRAERYGEPLTLCLMGITLEVANLKMSYEIKDRNLRLIGSTLSKLIRRCDSLGRLNAETFALLMPETSPSQAKPVCNRLINLLLEKKLDIDGLRIHVDLSIVAVECHAGVPASDLLAQAEKEFSGSGHFE
ncbi:MAG: GGDEF domain-containing protein [Deltaproteobacteria bacterium]